MLMIVFVFFRQTFIGKRHVLLFSSVERYRGRGGADVFTESRISQPLGFCVDVRRGREGMHEPGLVTGRGSR